MRYRPTSLKTYAPARLLIVPGLNDSPADHWQSWLQSLCRDSLRVVQHDWCTADVDRWAARIGSTVARAGSGPLIAVAHSFGVLALARHLALEPASPIAAALLVAPADPDKFGIADLLPARSWPMPATMVLSHTDQWLDLAAGQRWAARWGCHVVDLGDAGHINVASGFRTLPFARRWFMAVEQRLARESRPERASFSEWSFAV
jgi:predicted alpha/beta hydrolase family esterase